MAIFNIKGARDQNFWKWAVALIVISTILVMPSILNGFPYIFPDSPEYIKNGHTLGTDLVTLLRLNTRKFEDTHLYECDGNLSCSNPFYLRPFGYALFLIPFASHWTIYLLPLAQAALTALTVYYFGYCCNLRFSPKVCVFFASVLAIGSSLPYHVNHVMPDVFAGILILFTCASLTTWKRKNTACKILDVGAISFIGCMHLTFIPLMVALALFIFFACIFFKTIRTHAYPALIVLLTSSSIASFALCMVNFCYSKSFTLSLSSPVFLQARLLDAGPERNYLVKACTRKKYIICNHREQISVPNNEAGNVSVGDHFLWDPDGVAYHSKFLMPFVAEAKELNLGTIESYGRDVVWIFAIDGLKQLSRFDVDASSEKFPPSLIQEEADWLGSITINLERAFKSSRQYKNMIADEDFNFGTPSGIRLGIFLFSALILSVFLLRKEPISGPNQTIHFQICFCIFGVIANGILTGALSTLHARYESRVIWIVILLALCVIAAEWQKRIETPRRLIF